MNAVDQLQNASQRFNRMSVAIATVLVTIAAIAWISVYYLMSMGGMTVTGGMVGMFVRCRRNESARDGAAGHYDNAGEGVHERSQMV